jgi:hypothetical protein
MVARLFFTVLLRDAVGNLEIVYFNSSSEPTTEDFEVATFDAGWSVAGTGKLSTLGTLYAGIIWVNHATGQLGITRFTPFLKTTSSDQVFARLPADTEIQAIGGFNGDGAKDLLLWNASTSTNTIWFMNFYGEADFQVGLTLQPSLAPGWQVTAN